jgi:hypothetical protein
MQTAKRSTITFFSSSRRRVGLASLVLTLLAIGGWIRSEYVWDFLCFRVDPKHIYLVSSNCSVISWDFRDWPSPIRLYGNTKPQSSVIKSMTPEWHWEFYGFHAIKGHNTVSGHEISAWHIPYKFVVVPLALLTAYLLLSKSKNNAVENTSVKTDP